jgi:hypothetical protein
MMSKTTESLKKWLKSFHSGKVWLSKLRSNVTVRVYLPNFKRYCEATDKNPDELIRLKMEGQQNVGTNKEFQAEELHDLTIDGLDLTPHGKANMSMAVISFYKHNRRPFVNVKNFERPEAKKRTPTLSDIEDLGHVAKTRRDEFLIWFLATAPFREGTLDKLTFSDLVKTGDEELPIMVNVEAGRLKGNGRGKYKGLRQICFVNYFVETKLKDYVTEAKRRGIEINPETSLFVSYNGKGKAVKGSVLSKNRIRDIFSDLSLEAWDDLEQKRFSPHDIRSFTNTAMEKAKITENWRSVIMGHKPRGVKGKFYSDPATKELLAQFKTALPYIIPTHRQKTPEQNLTKKIEQYNTLAFNFLKTNIDATIKESEVLRAMMDRAKSPETKNLLEIQLSMKLDEIKKLKQMFKTQLEQQNED